MPRLVPKRLSNTEQTQVMESLGQQAAGWLLGIGGRTLRDRHDVPKNPGRPPTYNARDLVAWLVKQQAQPADKKIDKSRQQLEEAKARLACIKVEQEEGRWLPREEVRAGFAVVSQSLRGAGEILQRQFGPEALEVLNDALDDAQRALDSLLCADDCDSD